MSLNIIQIIFTVGQADHGLVHVATLQLSLQETVSLILDSCESMAMWLEVQQN